MPPVAEAASLIEKETNAHRSYEFCLFIFLTGSTGSTEYSPTKKKILLTLLSCQNQRRFIWGPGLKFNTLLFIAHPGLPGCR
jgi:hypothetical protein